MSDALDKLKSPPPPMMVPGCSTCRHRRGRDVCFWRCGAIGGHYTVHVYHTRCNGDMWEPLPPPVPALIRLKRWLIG